MATKSESAAVSAIWGLLFWWFIVVKAAGHIYAAWSWWWWLLPVVPVFGQLVSKFGL